MLNDTHVKITKVILEDIPAERCTKVTLTVDIYNEFAFTQRTVSKRLQSQVDLVGLLERVVCSTDYLNWPDVETHSS